MCYSKNLNKTNNEKLIYLKVLQYFRKFCSDLLFVKNLKMNINLIVNRYQNHCAYYKSTIS